jgi:hypothetical protein
MRDWFDRSDGQRRDWSDLDGPPPEPTTGPDPYAYPLASSLPPTPEPPQPPQSQPEPQSDASASIAPPEGDPGATAPVSGPARLYEPCDRCNGDAYAANRGFGTTPGRLLCSECSAIEYRFGPEPLSDAKGLALLARWTRNRLRRSGR